MAPKLSTKLERGARKQPSNVGMMPSILRPRRRILCADYNKVDTNKFIMSPTIDEISLPQPWSNVVVSPNTSSLTPSDMARNAHQLIGKINWEDEEIRQARKELLMPGDALYKAEDKEDRGQDGEEGSETNSLKVLSNSMMTDRSKDISNGQPERSSTYAETADAIRTSKIIAQDVLQSKATAAKIPAPREVSKNVLADDKTSPVRQPSSAPFKKGAAEDGGKASSPTTSRSAKSTISAEPDVKATKLSKDKARGQAARTKIQSPSKEKTKKRKRQKEEENKKAKNSPRTIEQLKKEEKIKAKEFEKMARELTRKANREVIEWKRKESEDSETVKRRNLAELMFSEKKMMRPNRDLRGKKERATGGRVKSTVEEQERNVTGERNRYRLSDEHYRLDEQATRVLAQNLPATGQTGSKPPFKHIFVFNPQLSVVENLSKYPAPAVDAGYTRKMLTRRMISDIRRTNKHVAEKFLKQ